MKDKLIGTGSSVKGFFSQYTGKMGDKADDKRFKSSIDGTNKSGIR